MMYFDTDVLVHYAVEQNPDLHKKAKKIIEQAAHDNIFVLSVYSLQEFSFVLEKLKQSTEVIKKNLEIFYQSKPILTTLEHFIRATEIAESIGFRHIGDCIHTAVAEGFCSELITCNKDDFKKIQTQTKLKITFL